MPKVAIILLFICFSFTISSCTTDSAEKEISEIDVNAEVQRFDVELFAQKYATPLERHRFLWDKYGDFYRLYVYQVLRIPEGDPQTVAGAVDLFVNDDEIGDVYRSVDSAYKNIDFLEHGMKEFFQHLKYYFPSDPVPVPVTSVMAFNYAVVATDSVIGIGLDMFLGAGAVYYHRLGVPKFMSSKFSREYIVPSAVKGWFQSDHDGSDVKKELLSQMIYQGKMLYYIKAMIPSFHDTLVTGYSAQQLEWCKSNEAESWSYFIENKLLYNTDPSVYGKFVNDGPATQGFPAEAPGKAGAFTGWQIVNAFMKKNKVSLPELLAENDSQKILELSGYKPKK